MQDMASNGALTLNTEKILHYAYKQCPQHWANRQCSGVLKPDVSKVVSSTAAKNYVAALLTRLTNIRLYFVRQFC